MELEGSVKMGDITAETVLAGEPLREPPVGLIMIETEGTDVCAADGTGC